MCVCVCRGGEADGEASATYDEKELEPHAEEGGGGGDTNTASGGGKKRRGKKKTGDERNDMKTTERKKEHGGKASKEITDKRGEGPKNPHTHEKEKAKKNTKKKG